MRVSQKLLRLLAIEGKKKLSAIISELSYLSVISD